MADKISVIYIEPGKYPKLTKIENTFQTRRALVGGDIEVMDLNLEDRVVIVCNESGKALGLPLNRAIWGKDRKLIDVVAGAFLVCYSPSGSFESMPEYLASKYMDIFRHPETFAIDEDAEAQPYTPAS